jgi:hypothetical protein
MLDPVKEDEVGLTSLEDAFSVVDKR